VATSVARACVVTVLLVAPSPGAARDRAAALPPTSLEPSAKKQAVVVSYVHRRVRACAPIPAKSPTTCAAQMIDSGAATSAAFEPVSVRAGAPSPNERVVVTFTDAPGLQKQTLELAVGEWAIEWPGCSDAGRLTVPTSATTGPTVALRTISGRCELTGKRCGLVDGAVEQRLSIGR
jgi:hypothetical protein